MAKFSRKAQVWLADRYPAFDRPGLYRQAAGERRHMSLGHRLALLGFGLCLLGIGISVAIFALIVMWAAISALFHG
jgi:hypothetical protein